MSYIQNFFTSRDNHANGNTYIGQQDRLWYNPETNSIRVSDGVTPGGKTIDLDLGANATFDIATACTVVTGTIYANAATVYGELIVQGNISPAANGKIGGITPGPGVNVSNSGLLTIDNANLPISFGNFYANNNVLSIVNADENMILQTNGNSEIQLVGNIGFYKPDGLPPNVANRYFSATTDGQISIIVPAVDPAEGAVSIIGSTSGNIQPPINTGVMLQITGQNGDQSRLYNDAIGGYSGFIGRRYNGTATSPTQVLNNDEIARLGINGYKTGGWLNIGQARISFVSTDNQDNSNNGAKIDFWSTPKGNTTANIVKVLSLDATYGANVVGNLNVTGNINGNVSGSNLTANLITGTLTTAAQPNITSVGTLTSLNVSGNANVGNLGTARVIATGNISATQLISNITTGVAPLVVTSTTQVANLNAATAGTVITNAQPNITSVGTLTSLNVSGNANVGNLGTSGQLLATGNITGNNFTANGNVIVDNTIVYNIASNNAVVTQLTSKTTPVTANGRTGQITTSNASLPQNSAITFTVNNSFVSANDVIIVNMQSGATQNAYGMEVSRVAAGSFDIQIRNFTNGALADTLVLNFAVIKVS